MSMSKWMRSLAAVAAGTFASAVAHAETARSEYNLPVGVTEISAEVHWLHMLILGVVTVIGILVFGAMIYSIINHRRSKHPKPADFHESVAVEIAWTIIPFFVLIAMAVPAAGLLIKMEDTRDAELTVKVTGFQWGWKYEYVGHGVEFVSMLSAESNAARQLGANKTVEELAKVDGGNYLWNVNNPLVLPTGRKVRFLITAQDVIHAWWVFDLAVKKDAIPGYINEAWTKIETPGTFRGVCAELCGRDHGFMPVVVQALPAAEFDSWLAGKKGVEVAAAAPVAVTEAAPAATLPAVPAAQPAAAAPAPAKALTKDELLAQGKKVYDGNCAACHQAAGTGLPPNFPSLVGSKVVNGDAKAHILHTLNGKGLMPPFKNLKDEEIAAVLSYQRQSWGNKASLVQPADVAAVR